MTQKQIQAYVKREMWRLSRLLWLNHWTVHFGFSEEPESDFVRARVMAREWECKQANIEFYTCNMRNDSKEEITNHVLHELLHVLVGEMKEKSQKHEERVVVHLADVIGSLDQETRKKAKA
jgi:predicted SprT family Zn-dependent metalloprotease